MCASSRGQILRCTEEMRLLLVWVQWTFSPLLDTTFLTSYTSTLFNTGQSSPDENNPRPSQPAASNEKMPTKMDREWNLNENHHYNKASASVAYYYCTVTKSCSKAKRVSKTHAEIWLALNGENLNWCSAKLLTLVCFLWPFLAWGEHLKGEIQQIQSTAMLFEVTKWCL